MVKRIALTATLALVAGALAAPASARCGDGRWQEDTRWHSNDRYYGYHYRTPPVVYTRPYNYYYAPPVVYGAEPGLNFTIRVP
jgi:hypothetical protein